MNFVISGKKTVQNKLKELSLSSSHRLKQSTLEENLSKNELESLKHLSRIPDIIIQKSDIVNSVVILNKKVCVENMNKMLCKNKQFLKLFHTR